MPTERIAMRRVREMLRLSLDAGLGGREIARRMAIAPSTFREMMRRFEASGLTWPLPLDLTDRELEDRLYGETRTKQGFRRRAEPDWAALNRELKKKHVTLQILWDEYIEAHPDGYRYSRFCDLYRSWEARLPVTMRQTHLGGDKLFVDYAGDTVPVIIDRRSGKTQPAHIFVAVMGASSLTFAYATWSEKLPDWIDGHVQAFAFFGGAPRLLVPDNPKVAIIKACLYDPQVGRAYGELAGHYDTAVLPARPRRPRDKAKVEAAVRIVERWLLGNTLLKGDWIDAAENLVICGPTGVGKSWISCALDHKACRNNRSVLYVRVPKLFDELALAHGDGSIGRRFKSLAAVQLLILDDWGLEPLDAQARHDLLEILEDRYGRRSTIVTSQLPVSAWHTVIGEATYADAILDRLVHNAHRLDLSGDSLRRPKPADQA